MLPSSNALSLLWGPRYMHRTYFDLFGVPEDGSKLRGPVFWAFEGFQTALWAGLSCACFPKRCFPVGRADDADLSCSETGYSQATFREWQANFMQD